MFSLVGSALYGNKEIKKRICFGGEKKKKTLTGLEEVEFEIAKGRPVGAVQRQSKVLPGSSGEQRMFRR